MNKFYNDFTANRYLLAKLASPHVSKLLGYKHPIINYDWQHDPRKRPQTKFFQHSHEEKNQIRWRY